MLAAGRVGLSAARTLLVSAVFIIVSADMAVGRQCYWCGPLAEQVHRSRRAPPCEGEGRLITVCEPGFDHCAVVATSPPYLESRFCVKLYLDECNPQFCNSTKTWKMTCPCRGDLCNGANTEREDDAFVVLGKLVAKTHSHVKKRTPTLQLTGNRKGRIVNPEQNDEPILADNSIDEISSNVQTKNMTSLVEKDKVETTEKNTESSIIYINIMSSTNQPIATEKAESKNDFTSQSVASDNPAEIGSNEELTANDKEGTGASIQLTSAKVDLENETSTVMIDIDIVQRPSNLYHSTQVIKPTTIHEFDIQNDDPVQQNDQVDVDVTKQNTRVTETPESTSDPLKPQIVKIMTTSHSPPAEPSINLVDNLEANNNLKPESTKPKDASLPEPSQKQPKEIVRTHITEAHMTSTMASTIANTVSGKTVASSKKSSKDKDKNNTAIRLSVNTLIIIQCVLTCTNI